MGKTSQTLIIWALKTGTRHISYYTSSFTKQHVNERWGFYCGGLLFKGIINGPTRTPPSHAVSTSKRGLPLIDGSLYLALIIRIKEREREPDRAID
jgi:hypothetical protein